MMFTYDGAIPYYISDFFYNYLTSTAMKKQYQKPESQVINLKLNQSILAGSGVGLNGLPDQFYYDNTPGDGSDAY